MVKKLTREEIEKGVKEKEEFSRRVQNGESPNKVSKDLGITLVYPL